MFVQMSHAHGHYCAVAASNCMLSRPYFCLLTLYLMRNELVSILDVGNLVVMAGLVDSHVHVNDPGRAHWEGFPTATRAAAAGGVTCIVDMPL